MKTLEGHREYVWSVSWSSDRKKIASCSDDLSVKIWDAWSGDMACFAKDGFSLLFFLKASQAKPSMVGFGDCFLVSGDFFR